MNKVVLTGRLVRDPEIRYSTGEQNKAIAKYTIAVNRSFDHGKADFINCVAFGKAAEFAEKYFKKGNKIDVSGRIQTGNYINKDGQKVYTTDVVVEEHEFGESKSANQSSDSRPEPYTGGDNDFVNIPENISEELPFS